MFCSNCGEEIKEEGNFCPKCGKKIIDTGNTINQKVADSINLSESNTKIIYFATICMMLIYIVTNIFVEMVKYTERGFSYDAVNDKVMAHAYGIIAGVIILTIICSIVNKYKFSAKKVKRGFVGIAISYAIIIGYMMLHVMETPNGMSNSEAYNDMINMSKGFKVIDVLILIAIIGGYGYLSGAKKISLFKDSDNEVCSALLFGALGAVPALLYVAACF